MIPFLHPRRERATPRLYFFHIPKTAGMSLWTVLERQYDSGEVFPGHLMDDLLAASRDELSRCRLFRGHFGLTFHDRVPGRTARVVLLRDPSARALSMYGHVRRDPGHFGHEAVNAPGYSFSDFLRDPLFLPLVSNYHARYLAFRPGPEQFRWTPPIRPGHSAPAQAVHDLHPLNLRPEALRRTAAATLDASDVVGVTEFLEEACQQIAYRMGWRSLGVPPHINTGNHALTVQNLSLADRKLLEELNTVDLELYELARKRLRADRQRMVSRLLKAAPSATLVTR